MNPFQQEIQKRANPFRDEQVKRGSPIPEPFGAGSLPMESQAANDALGESPIQIQTGGPPPIPAPFKPELAPPLPGPTRDTYIGSGATIGGIGGSLAGIPGTLAGGALGAAGGSAAYDASRALFDRMHGYKGLEATERLENTAEGMADAAYDDALWSMGGMSALRALSRAKPVVGSLLGVNNKETRRLADMAKAQGIGLGATHLSKSRVVRAMPKVLGVFPFVGTPYRTGQVRVIGQMDDRAADLLNTLAPTSTKQDIGEKLTKAASKRYSKADTIASTLYKRFSDTAAALPVKDIVDTAPLKDEMARIAQREGIEAITLEGGKTMTRGTDPVGDYLRQITELPERITVEQARGLERQFNAIMREGGTQGWDLSRLEGVKGALEKAKNALDVSRLPPDLADDVLKKWKAANEFFSGMKRATETPTARRFGRVDKDIFGKGFFKAGTINQDEVYDAVFRAKSPQAMSDLRNLVGGAEFRSASRKFLEGALEKSRVRAKEGDVLGDLFSAADFEKRIGLDSQEGWDSLKEMLKGSGVTVDQWRDFLDVAKKATDIAVRDPSTFLARRAILTGGVAGGLVMGSGSMSLPAAATAVLATRGLTRFLMSPKQLKLMMRSLSPTTSDAVRYQLVARLLKPEADKPRNPRLQGLTKEGRLQ